MTPERLQDNLRLLRGWLDGAEYAAVEEIVAALEERCRIVGKELDETVDEMHRERAAQEKRIAELEAELAVEKEAAVFFRDKAFAAAQLVWAKDTELERLRTALDHAAAALILCGAIKPCATCAKHGKEAEDALKLTPASE